MSLTAFPYGVSSFGIPIIGAGPILTTGSVWFVSSGTGVDANGRGTDPSRPFATLDYAIGKCTASKGDTIILMPGHAESIIAAGTVTADVAGIEIIGLGHGTLRPTFTFSTATSATFLVSAANVKIRNLYFAATGIDSLVTGVSVTAADCTLEGCDFLMGDSSEQALTMITVGGDRLTIDNCRFRSPNGGPTAAIYGAAAKDWLQVVNCKFIGHFSTACIHNETAAWTNCYFNRNRMAVQSATGIGISVHASATGIASENYTYVTANVAAAGSIAMAAGYLFQNYGLEFAHVGTSATLDPTAGGWA